MRVLTVERGSARLLDFGSISLRPQLCPSLLYTANMGSAGVDQLFPHREAKRARRT